MSIELPAEEVRALGRSLAARGETAGDVRARLAGDDAVAGPLRTPVADLLAHSGLLAAALDGELTRLGGTVAAVADSWLALDAGLVPPAATGER